MVNAMAVAIDELVMYHQKRLSGGTDSCRSTAGVFASGGQQILVTTDSRQLTGKPKEALAILTMQSRVRYGS